MDEDDEGGWGGAIDAPVLSTASHDSFRPVNTAY